ncbi:MAG: type II toxin-antitoxin system RelE/ParE family toxin [Bacteroidetes bacterium]|nr:type II toxin-antitoxin system RelE/ParE family toxin [Bacteroidota bacterium]
MYDYGVETFGTKAANYFIEDLYENIASLNKQFYLHPECRHLHTKTKIYRNIIKGAYLIIYRIKSDNIEILIAIRGDVSISKIKAARKVRV